MSPADCLGLLAAIDGLYEQVVSDPAAWGEPEFADWAAETLGTIGADKQLAREARRALRVARKLQQRVDGTSDGPGDWRSRVDAHLGTRAWEPGLAIARIGLERTPDPDLFDEVKRRIAEARFDRWMEGVGYEEWLESSS